MRGEQCSWCGEAVETDAGYRLGERAGERRAAFCRLEHIIPWAIQGAHWQPGLIDEPADTEAPAACAQCGKELDDSRLMLVRHRGEHRVADAFCGVSHLREWAQAGGRWR